MKRLDKILSDAGIAGRKEIKDILAYLKTIDNGKDDLSVKRIINVPRRGIGAASITKVQDYADEHGISFFEALSYIDDIPGLKSGKASEKLREFTLMIRGFKTKLEHYDLEELITDLLDTTKYTQELEADDDDEAKDRLQNIDELITKIVSFQIEKEKNSEEATLSAFLEEVALVADIDNVKSDDNRVLLMTIHSAK